MESQIAVRLWNKYERSSVCAAETCRDIVKGVGFSVNIRDSKIYEGIIIFGVLLHWKELLLQNLSIMKTLPISDSCHQSIQ